MKGLTKKHLLQAIQINFKDTDVIYENDNILKTIFEKLGDDWFIVDGIWKCSKNNHVMWDD